MSHDHIGTPKFIMKGFSINNHVWCYNTLENKEYNPNINKLGVEKNYYDEDVEKDVLANDVEAKGAAFIKEFTNLINFNNKQWEEMLISFTKNNKLLISRLISYMYMRSKKALKQINEESVLQILYEDITPSELLRLQAKLEIDITTISSGAYDVWPVIVSINDKDLINNSLGFTILIKEFMSFFIPLNTRCGVFIAPTGQLEDKVYLLNSSKRIDHMNKCIVRLEKVFGNGYFFSKKESDLDTAIEYFNM